MLGSGPAEPPERAAGRGYTVGVVTEPRYSAGVPSTIHSESRTEAQSPAGRAGSGDRDAGARHATETGPGPATNYESRRNSIVLGFTNLAGSIIHSSRML